ncbi:MAG TPA: EamA family transporter [Clostridia bacterium]|nr:EamA family transporter [Clostridia bacterium]
MSGIDARTIYTWSAIMFVVLTTTAGDVLLAEAMHRIGDLGDFRKRHGMLAAARRVLADGRFMVALFFMALSFFFLLVGLSWADVSLVVPAAASLTFITNALAARVFLHEKVDKRRWISALFVAAGVAMLAY